LFGLHQKDLQALLELEFEMVTLFADFDLVLPK
jgi:hypothetical protein